MLKSLNQFKQQLVGAVMDKRNEKMSNDVVKTNRLNMAIQNLSLAEIRLIQLAIIDARETGKGIDTVTPLAIHASRYAESFDVTRQTAYEVLKEAETTLFKRYFTFLDERDDKPVKSHWISQAKYLSDDAIIEIMLTPAVVNEIIRMNAISDSSWFTRFALEQVASMTSVYSVRLYELLTQWRKAKKATFDLEIFRGQLGLGVNEYKQMSDFKRRVLDLAVNEINEKSDLKVSYTNIKRGRKITGFNFKILEKPKPKKDIKEQNGDLFTIDGLSDAQLFRITRHKDFISTYAHLAKGDAAQNWNLFSEVMINKIKKNPEEFNKKRPIREYLKGAKSDYHYDN